MLGFKAFNNKISPEDEKLLSNLKSILGYKPKNPFYFKKAFTHSSVNKTLNNKPFNYERLEFLGDSILDSVIACFLYNEAPNGDEGYLTKMRSKIVSRINLNDVGKKIDLRQYIDSKVEKNKFSENIYGNIYEALVGAVYLDKGFEGCKKFIYKTLIIPYVDIERLEGKITSYKSVMIEWCQKHKRDINYQVYQDYTKEKINHFAVRLSVDNKVVSKGRATSKKKAEEIASKRAYYSFQHDIEKIS